MAISLYESKVQPFLTDIHKYISHGVTEKQLYTYFKVGKTAWEAYKKRYSELSEALYHAREEFHIKLINKAYEVAMGCIQQETITTETVNAKGEKSIKTITTSMYIKPDTGMIQFLLINRFPQDYARDPQVIELRKQMLELQKQQNKTNMGSA